MDIVKLRNKYAVHPSNIHAGEWVYREHDVLQLINDICEQHRSELRIWEQRRQARAALHSTGKPQAIPSPAVAQQPLTDSYIDDSDTGALHVMAPRGRDSVREFARRIERAHGIGVFDVPAHSTQCAATADADEAPLVDWTLTTELTSAQRLLEKVIQNDRHLREWIEERHRRGGPSLRKMIEKGEWK